MYIIIIEEKGLISYLILVKLSFSLFGIKIVIICVIKEPKI